MRELAAAWAQLEQASKDFELQPLAQVYAELSATRAQLLGILAQDGALPPDATPVTTGASVSENGMPGATSTGAATTTTSGDEPGTTTEDQATTTAPTTTRDPTTTGQTTTDQTAPTTTTEQTTTTEPPPTTP